MTEANTIVQLKITLANTYALFLKTQNYHWHVKGPLFKTYHELFEGQYNALFEAIDVLAERILMLDGSAPATFDSLSELSTLAAGDSQQSAEAMLQELANDHQALIANLNDVLQSAQSANDEGTIALIGERIAAHEKDAWMLRASQR